MTVTTTGNISKILNIRMRKNETTHVRISLKDQLDILSKYYGVTRATILNALVEEKFQSLREENNGNFAD